MFNLGFSFQQPALVTLQSENYTEDWWFTTRGKQQSLGKLKS